MITHRPARRGEIEDGSIIYGLLRCFLNELEMVDCLGGFESEIPGQMVMIHWLSGHAVTVSLAWERL